MTTIGVPFASAAWRRAARSGITSWRTRSRWAKPAAVTSTRSGGAKSGGSARLVSTTTVDQPARGSPSTGSSPGPDAGSGGAVVVVARDVVVLSSGLGPAVSVDPSDTRVESHVAHSPTPTPTTRITVATAARAAIQALTAAKPMSPEPAPRPALAEPADRVVRGATGFGRGRWDRYAYRSRPGRAGPGT